MADFLTAYRIVHGHEGGYANVAGDKGGETYQGIARNYHPQWPGWVIIDAVKLTRPIKRYEFIQDPQLVAAVQAFYRASWNAIQGDKITNQAVANFIYDFSTNSGQAIAVVQRLLVNVFQRREVTPISNNVGPRTLAAINAVDQVLFHNAMKVARRAYVKKLADDDPDDAKFLPSWLKRINSFPDLEKKSSLPA